MPTASHTPRVHNRIFDCAQQLLCTNPLSPSTTKCILLTLFDFSLAACTATATGHNSSSMTKQAKLETFLKKQGVKVSPEKKQPRSSSSPAKQQKQARLQQCAGVLVLPTMGGGGARTEELQRLLLELDASRSDEVITQALRQLGCYEVTVEQVGSRLLLQFARLTPTVADCTTTPPRCCNTPPCSLKSSLWESESSSCVSTATPRCHKQRSGSWQRCVQT